MTENGTWRSCHHLGINENPREPADVAHAMPSLMEALAPWHEFYTLLGSASATMVGLLFVAASVGSGVFSRNRTAGLRMFLSASVVHFGSILAVCLIVLAPVQSVILRSFLVLACGLFGLAYSALAWRGTVRDGISVNIDLEDRFWYALLPVVGYLFETAAGVILTTRTELACGGLAVSAGILLLAAVHNAWDITVWSVTRKQD